MIVTFIANAFSVQSDTHQLKWMVTRFCSVRTWGWRKDTIYRHQQQPGTKTVDDVDKLNNDEPTKRHKWWHTDFCCFRQKYAAQTQPISALCPWIDWTQSCILTTFHELPECGELCWMLGPKGKTYKFNNRGKKILIGRGWVHQSVFFFQIHLNHCENCTITPFEVCFFSSDTRNIDFLLKRRNTKWHVWYTVCFTLWV